jgi:hypothetical protein
MINISILLKRPLLKTQKHCRLRWISRFLANVDLADPAQHSIKKDVDFIIERASSLTTSQNEEKKPLILTKTETKLFFINFSKVHQDYHKEYPNVKVRK